VGGEYYFPIRNASLAGFEIGYTMTGQLVTSSQVISIGNNLIDFSNTVKKTDLCTVLIPVGQNGLTIEDYHGSVYIIDDAAVAKYGKIWKKVTFDTDDDEELYNLAVDYLAEAVKPQVSITAKAIDLSILDSDVPRFKIGDIVRVYSPPHGIDTRLSIRSIRLDIANPGSSEFTIGQQETKLV
jgi:phage minor structural protein